MKDLEDWAAVQKVYRQTKSKRATAKILHISRNTVKRLLDMTAAKSLRADIRVEASKSQVGGGSLPAQYMDSYSVAVNPSEMSVNELEQKMRLTEPHIVGRIANEKYYLDVRSIFEEELSAVSAKLSEILK